MTCARSRIVDLLNILLVKYKLAVGAARPGET